MNLTRLQRILDRAASKRIMVIGDLMLDEFVWGKVGRISPEAPVPVVEVERESFHAGGAANVARNLREFTKGVAVMGSIGTGQRTAITGSARREKDRHLQLRDRLGLSHDRQNTNHRATSTGRARRSRESYLAFGQSVEKGGAICARSIV